MTNQHVLNITQRKHLSEILLSKQLRVLGHWHRRPPETTIKKYSLYTTNQGRNRRGRRRATYVKIMEKSNRNGQARLDSISQKPRRVEKICSQ